MMTATDINILGDNVDLFFFVIGATMLAIEILKAVLSKKFTKLSLADMLVNASTQIPYLIVEIGLLFTAYQFYSYIGDTFISWQFQLNLIVIIMAVIVADFFYYWEHRLAHQVRILWVQHAVHHSSRKMNITTGIRFGPFEGVWSTIISFPMVLIGFSPELVFFGILVVLAYQTWIHTELIPTLGPFEKIINTPALHRVHHGYENNYQDKNYGGILIIWDRIFGSYQPEIEMPKFGLARDFSSVNPFIVWFSEYPKLFKDIKQSNSVKEVFCQLFFAPNWKP